MKRFEPGRNNHTPVSGVVMSVILIFARKWNACYRVLRYRNGFSFVDSVRWGLWLARGVPRTNR